MNSTTPAVTPPSYACLIMGIIVSIALAIATGWSFFRKDESGRERVEKTQITETVENTAVPTTLQTEISGIYELKGELGFIQESSPETSDRIFYFFKINSLVGKQVAETCLPGEMCRITAQVVQRTDLPIEMEGNASAIFEIIGIDAISQESTHDFRIRAGKIRIDNDNPNGRMLLLDDRTVYVNKSARALSVEQLFSLKEKDVILLGIDTADISCPITYVFISILPDGGTVISKAFGDCLSMQGVEQIGDAIRVMMPVSEEKPGKVFVYQNDAVAEETVNDNQHDPVAEEAVDNGHDSAMAEEKPEGQDVLTEAPRAPVQSNVSDAQKKKVLAVLGVAATGEWESIEALVADIRKHAPKMDYGDRKSGRIFNQEGLVFLKQKQFLQAINAFNKGLIASPADVEIRNNLAYAYMLNGNLKDAENHLLNIVLRIPDRTSAWATYAEILARAATAQPEDAEAFKKISHAFLRLAVYFSANRQKTSEYLERISQTHEIPIFRHIARAVSQEMAHIPSRSAPSALPQSSTLPASGEKARKKENGITVFMDLLKKVPKGEMPEDDPWK